MTGELDLPDVSVEPASALAALRLLVDGIADNPGQSLPTERGLAAQLGIGRRAVRKGLAVLEAEGQIWRRQGVGTFIGPAAMRTPPTFGRLSGRTNFREVMQVRLNIEPALARLAACNARRDQVAMLRQLAERTRAVKHDDPAGLERWDGAFHRCIAEAAGNQLFLDLFALVDAIRHDELWEHYRAKARSEERLKAAEYQHFAIVEAIEKGAPEDAASVMHTHIKALQDSLEAALDEAAHDDG